MNRTKYLIVAVLLAVIVAVVYWGDRDMRRSFARLMPTSPVILYFATEDASGVSPEVRWMAPSESDALGRLKALVDGPSGEHVYRSVPRGTGIHSVQLVGDTAVVDFDRGIIEDHPGGSAGELITIFSIVNTMTEIDGVQRVVFQVDGNDVETLAGHFDLRHPVERDESLIVSTTSQRYDR